MFLKQVYILITAIKHRQRQLDGDFFCSCFHHCKMNAQGIVPKTKFFLDLKFHFSTLQDPPSKLVAL